MAKAPKPPQNKTQPAPEHKPTPENDIHLFPYLMKTVISVIRKHATSGIEEKVFFPVVFKLDEASVKMPWWVLQNHLAPKYVKSKLGQEGAGWVRIYERKIEKIINRLDPSNIKDIPLRVLTLEQLKQFCQIKELYDVDVDVFNSLAEARRMVSLRLEDPTGYKQQLQEFIERAKNDYPEVRKYIGQELESVASEDLLNQFEELDAQPLTKTSPTKTPPTALFDSMVVESGPEYFSEPTTDAHLKNV